MRRIFELVPILSYLFQGNKKYPKDIRTTIALSHTGTLIFDSLWNTIRAVHAAIRREK